jgi:hypothetical protein
MPAVNAILECLSWLEIAAYVVLYVRLRSQGLYRVYRVFAVYLLFRAVRSVALAVLPWACYTVWGRPYGQFENKVYGYLWALTEPVVWFLQVLVVLELYSLVLQNFKGIASMGRWVLLASLAVAIVLSSVTLPSELSHSAQHDTILRGYLVVSCGLDASLVIFLLFITAFLAWFPVPLNRNVVLYSMVYALYFITDTLAKLASNLVGASAWSAVNIAGNCMDLLCLGVWIVFLNRSGEAQKVVVGHAWTEEHEEELMGQLEAINSSLTRSARR